MVRDTPYQADVRDFLRSAGGAGILLVIDQSEGTTHNEFVPLTDVSRATVTKRVQEAEKLDLIEATQFDDDHGNTKRYFLTRIGRVYRVALESMGLGETYRTYVDAQQSLENGLAKMGDWVVENDRFWTGKNLGEPFEFEDPLKDADIYPGDDVPSDFETFIWGELTHSDRLKEFSEQVNDPDRYRLDKD